MYGRVLLPESSTRPRVPGTTACCTDSVFPVLGLGLQYQLSCSWYTLCGVLLYCVWGRSTSCPSVNLPYSFRSLYGQSEYCRTSNPSISSSTPRNQIQETTLLAQNGLRLRFLVFDFGV
eukprot:1756965-Rhodomonas_salina.1